ncbi:MAG: hypothetical protein ACM65L_03575 [Microcoleus sp.]
MQLNPTYSKCDRFLFFMDRRSHSLSGCDRACFFIDRRSPLSFFRNKKQ